MTQYAHEVKIKMACGCTVESKQLLMPDHEPSGATVFATLIKILETQEVQEMFTEDPHTDKGEESIDITIRTKVVE